MFYLNENEKSRCTGCQACKHACPKNAIDMIEDEEGFLYPQKNNNCIECGLCESVCPLNNNIENKIIEQEVYAAIYRDDNVLNNSSSGGAFTAICNCFCDENYVIFGAEYDEKFKVKHGYADNIKDIEKFRKSKYVQSDINDSYKQVKEMLKDGKKVIFSGTPCQIAGLKSFLKNKEYNNLLCIDIICHGVPSPKVWRKYLEHVENKYNSKIKEVNFREKTNKNDRWNSKNIKIELERNRTIVEDNIKNYYLTGFRKELLFRPSCATCNFANLNRVSDITIGDCWGIEKINEELDVHKGVSLIVINTQKGKEIFNNLSKYMELQKLDLNFAIKENEQLRKPTKFHKNREKFYRNIEKNRFDKLIKKYAKDTYKIRIKRNILRLMPKGIKEKVKMIIKR